MTAELFAVVRAKAAEMSATAELFVCLLWFTGHRGASVRQLRWDDIDLTAKTVHWRADVDKVGYDHRNPLHSELIPQLERAQAVAEITGEVCLFSSTIEPSESMTRDMAALLWRRSPTRPESRKAAASARTVSGVRSPTGCVTSHCGS